MVYDVYDVYDVEMMDDCSFSLIFTQVFVDTTVRHQQSIFDIRDNEAFTIISPSQNPNSTSDIKQLKSFYLGTFSERCILPPTISDAVAC